MKWSRRQLLQLFFGSTILASSRQFPAFAKDTALLKGEAIFERILSKARSGKWSLLPIGELTGRIAIELEGTPYVGHTLEVSIDREVCTVDLEGLDCVTFFENALCLARVLKKHHGSASQMSSLLIDEVTFTRYRSGVLDDYTSRLHYTSDWLFDNERKGVVKILADLPGAEPFVQRVGFMSEHPAAYPQLAAHPEFLPKMIEIEKNINSRALKFVPLERLAGVESFLKTGDIVAVCTNSPPGIDVVHTGLVYVTKDGIVHFMDASSSKSKMKVLLEPGSLSNALNWSKSITGAMFARPLEPTPKNHTKERKRKDSV